LQGDHIDENLKRSFELLKIPEHSTLPQVEAAYRALSRNAAWNEIKELNLALEAIKEYFALQPEPDSTVPGVPEPPVHISIGTPAGSSSNKKLYVVAACSSVLIVIMAIFMLKGSGFFKSSDTGDISSLVKAVKPAIVTILTEDVPRGSGFLVSKDGYIVTNAHVMREKTAKAAFSDGSSHDVSLVFVDPEMDFALLKAADSRTYPYLNLADSSACAEGDTVIAAGTPLSFQTTFTRGIISAVRRSFPAYKAAFIQTDAALSPGNSGGPLINMKGDVIGINSLKISGAAVEGMGFAVSINDVKKHILARQQMNDADLTRELARMEKKMEEMNQWRDPASQKVKDKIVEEQWEQERRRREFYSRVDEANRDLKEQKEREERRIREEGERYRTQARENIEAKRKALSDCLQNAQSYYMNGWNDSCKSLNLDTQCKLPYSTAHILEQRHMQSRNECFRLYPQ
jgi:hypothetical protein